MTAADDERVRRLVAAAVERGMPLSELTTPRARRTLLVATGVREVPAAQWRRVRDGLRSAMVRAGGSGECSECRAPIVWGRTERGKSMPVDPLPHPRGNVLIRRTPAGGVGVLVRPNADLPLPAPAFRSHFVTCSARRGRPPAHASVEVASCASCGSGISGVELQRALAVHRISVHAKCVRAWERTSRRRGVRVV